MKPLFSLTHILNLLYIYIHTIFDEPNYSCYHELTQIIKDLFLKHGAMIFYFFPCCSLYITRTTYYNYTNLLYTFSLRLFFIENNHEWWHTMQNKYLHIKWLFIYVFIIVFYYYYYTWILFWLLLWLLLLILLFYITLLFENIWKIQNDDCVSPL